MGRPKKSNNYIDNDELKDMVVTYVRLNPHDNGEWLKRYITTMTTRCQKKPDKWPAIKDFFNRRTEFYKNRQLSQEDLKEFEIVSAKLTKALYKMADGILVSLHLILDEEAPDLRNEAVMSGLKYCNRFDEEINTSCFAFMTQTLKNAILLYIKRRNEEYADGMIVPEYKLFDTRGVDELGGDALSENTEE